MSTNALGLFDAPSTAIEAAGALKGAGFDSPTVISPIPLHGIDEVLGKKKSVIKRFTFFGALFGGIAGFSLAAGTAVMYVHATKILFFSPERYIVSFCIFLIKI